MGAASSIRIGGDQESVERGLAAAPAGMAKPAMKANAMAARHQPSSPVTGPRARRAIPLSITSPSPVTHYIRESRERKRA